MPWAWHSSAPACFIFFFWFLNYFLDFMHEQAWTSKNIFSLFLKSWTIAPCLLFLCFIKFDLVWKQDELSSAKLSSLSWGWVELRLSWVVAELELNLSWDRAWQVFELFNWSFWILQLKYLKSCSNFILSLLVGGWVGRWCLKVILRVPWSILKLVLK